MGLFHLSSEARYSIKQLRLLIQIADSQEFEGDRRPSLHAPFLNFANNASELRMNARGRFGHCHARMSAKVIAIDRLRQPAQNYLCVRRIGARHAEPASQVQAEIIELIADEAEFPLNTLAFGKVVQKRCQLIKNVGDADQVCHIQSGREASGGWNPSRGSKLPFAACNHREVVQGYRYPDDGVDRLHIDGQ